MSKRPRLLEKSESQSQQRADQSATQLHDAYVFPSCSLLSNFPVRRPFPPSTILHTKAVGTRKKVKPSPLLCSFLAALGREPESGASHDDEEQGESGGQSDDRKELWDIDNPKHSTLTLGQHRKYLKLVSSRQDWKAPQHKEFRKFNALVRTEQERYRQALLDFWEGNKDRVLWGFSQSSVSSCAAKFAQAAAFPDPVKNAWKKEFARAQYGKCCQVITLEQPHKADKVNHWMVDSIEGRVLEQPSSSATIHKETIPPIGTIIPIPPESPPVNFLKNDERAKMLAQEHKVDILTTLESIECLLKIEDAQWMIPVSFQGNHVALVDNPFPHPFLSPRDCLERGLEGGLECYVHPDNLIDGTPKDGAPYRYALLTLPQSSSGAVSTAPRPKSKRTRVLIRIPNRSSRLHPHIEYFPERGEEMPSSHARSLWILDQILFSKSVVARIDPSTCTLLNCEQTSVAHALAGGSHPQSSPTGQSLDPMDHWHHLAQLFQAIPSIGHSGSYMICFPGRGSANLSSLSASVHAETRNSNESVIDIEQELDRAGEVILGSKGVRRSIRGWAWNEERAPYTFPPLPDRDARDLFKRSK